MLSIFSTQQKPQHNFQKQKHRHMNQVAMIRYKPLQHIIIGKGLYIGRCGHLCRTNQGMEKTCHESLSLFITLISLSLIIILNHISRFKSLPNLSIQPSAVSFETDDFILAKRAKVICVDPLSIQQAMCIKKWVLFSSFGIYIVTV